MMRKKKADEKRRNWGKDVEKNRAAACSDIRLCGRAFRSGGVKKAFVRNPVSSGRGEKEYGVGKRTGKRPIHSQL